MSKDSKETLGRDADDIEVEDIIESYMEEDEKEQKKERPKYAQKKSLLGKPSLKKKTKKKTKTGVTDKDIKQTLKNERNNKPVIGMSKKASAKYKSIAHASDVKLSKEQITGNKLERKPIEKYIILGSKIALSVCILLFVMSLFMSWYTVTGDGASEGFIRIEENITPDLEKELVTIGEPDEVTRVADFSPMKLFSYSVRFRESYKVSIDDDGVHGTSTYARLHLFFTYMFILVLAGSLISIAILLIGKDFQFAHIVRSFGFLGLFTMIINYIALKVPFFSMISLRVQTIMNVQNPDEAARMTNLGVVSGDQIYTYGMEALPSIKFAFVVLIIWIILSAIMGEINNRMDDYKRMTEVD